MGSPFPRDNLTAGFKRSGSGKILVNLSESASWDAERTDDDQGTRGILRDADGAVLVEVTGLPGSVASSTALVTVRNGAAYASESGLATSKTGVQNKAALEAALAGAVAAQATTVVLPVGTFDIAGTITVPAGLRVAGAGRKRTTLRQTSKPNAIFWVPDPGCTFEDFAVLGAGLDMTGLAVPDFQGYVGIRVKRGAHDTTVRRVDGKDIYCVVLNRDYNENGSVPAKTYRLVFDDVAVEGVWSALHGGPWVDPTINNVRGSYRKAFSTDGTDTGQKPHLIYAATDIQAGTAVVGWLDSYRNKGGTVTNCSAWDAPNTGAAYALKFWDGLSASDLRARNCPGIIDNEYLADCSIARLTSTDDKYPASGEESGRGSYAIKDSVRSIATDVSIAFASSDHGAAVTTESTATDCTINGLTIVSNRSVENLTGDDVKLSGTRNVIKNADIVGIGAAGRSAIRIVGTGSGGLVVNPKIGAGFKYKIRQETNHAGSFIDYDPALTPADRAVSGAVGLSVVTGAFPTLRNRALGQAVPLGASDLFDRPDVSGLVATDDGKVYAITGTTDLTTFRIASNAAYFAGGAARAIVYADAGTANGTLKITVGTIGTGLGGAAIRVVDSANFIGVQYSKTSGNGQLQLYKRIAGTLTELGTSAVGAVANGAVIEIVASGNNVSAKLNGVEVVAPVAVTDFAASTLHGLVGLSTGTDVRHASWQFTPA